MFKEINLRNHSSLHKLFYSLVMEVITPTNFRKDIFRIIKGIVQNKKTVEITINSEKGFNDGVVVIDKEKYNQLKELEYLEKTGTLDTVMDRMKNSNEDDFVDL